MLFCPVISKIIFEHLISYYRHNCRNLPWRNSKNPYEIWVSEVILQQTRVAQGLDYFMTFLRYFPDVKTLAAAQEEQLLKVWQGLGYYNRARNMQTAAKQISEQHNGNFPETYDAIRNLKGVGDYTAAAVASIAFGLSYACVDGNVKRVVARLLGIGDSVDKAKTVQTITDFLNGYISSFNPGEFNQAMMELGATVCTPTKPRCEECPLKPECYAYKHGVQTELPVRTAKKKPEVLYVNYLFYENVGNTWVSKRGNESIWKGLFEFPHLGYLKNDDKFPPESLLRNPASGEVYSFKEYIHKLTHRTIFARFWQLSGLPSNIVRETNELLQIPVADLEKYPVHRLMHRYLEDMDLVETNKERL